jgi:hypothetical protein
MGKLDGKVAVIEGVTKLICRKPTEGISDKRVVL